MWMALEDVHRWSLYHISGQTMSVSSHPRSEKGVQTMFRQMYLYFTASAPASYPAPGCHSKTMTNAAAGKAFALRAKYKTKLRAASAFYFKRAEDKDQAVQLLCA